MEEPMTKRGMFFIGTGNSPILNEIPKRGIDLYKARISKHAKAKKAKAAREKRTPKNGGE
jgi:hypothetical protein